MVPSERTVTVGRRPRQEGRAPHRRLAARRHLRAARRSTSSPTFDKLNPWYYTRRAEDRAPAARHRAPHVDVRRGGERPRRDQRAVRGAPLPVLRQLLRVRQLLRRVPRQRGDQARARASASSSTTTTARAAASACPSAPAARSRWCRKRSDGRAASPATTADERRQPSMDDKRRPARRSASPTWFPQGRRAAARPDAQQGHGVHRGRARRAGPARPAAAARALAGRAGRRACWRTSAQADRPREVHQPHRAARPQRGAVLPDRHRQSGRDDADHLHADGRPRLPAVRPHLPAPARPVHQRERPRPRRERAAQLAVPRRRDHRRHRRRAHPRPGRPRRQRHGHPGRQALALHGLRRHPPERSACR